MNNPVTGAAGRDLINKAKEFVSGEAAVAGTTIKQLQNKDVGEVAA